MGPPRTHLMCRQPPTETDGLDEHELKDGSSPSSNPALDTLTPIEGNVNLQGIILNSLFAPRPPLGLLPSSNRPDPTPRRSHQPSVTMRRLPRRGGRFAFPGAACVPEGPFTFPLRRLVCRAARAGDRGASPPRDRGRPLIASALPRLVAGGRRAAVAGPSRRTGAAAASTSECR